MQNVENVLKATFLSWVRAQERLKQHINAIK